MNKPPCMVWLPADHRLLGDHGHQMPFLLLGDKYARAVKVGAQAQPVMFPLADAEQIDELLSLVDGVMLTGSPSNVHPSHFQEEVADPSLPLDPARDGRPVLVYFWASWCAICRMQHGAIADIAREHPVVSVAMRSGDAAAVRRHLTEQAAAFDVINDPHGLHAARWGVGAVPASFIVDARGRVRFVEVGYTTGWGLRWRLWWAGWRVGP